MPVSPANMPIAPELAERLETMAHDLAGLQQRIEQLNTNQEQAARENAGLVEELKAMHGQIAGDRIAIDQLTALQAKMAGHNATFGDELRISNERLTSLLSKVDRLDRKPSTKRRRASH
jgi:FtsZ-binding cell division protein ZapB